MTVEDMRMRKGDDDDSLSSSATSFLHASKDEENAVVSCYRAVKLTDQMMTTYLDKKRL